MNIPDKAVEAAAQAIHEADPNRDLRPVLWDDLTNDERWDRKAEAVAALKAAAPFIAAQALRDYADVVSDGRVSFRDSEARGLRDRAKWLEAGA